MSPRKAKTETGQAGSQPESPSNPQPEPKRPATRARKKPPAAEPAADVVETPVEVAGEEIAPAADAPASSTSTGRIVVFSLAGQLYAFPIECVQEIQQIVAYTDCPDPVPALVGMVNLRGLVVPLVDLRLLLAMEPAPYTLETPMIICRVHDQIVAVAVDEVEDVVEMPEGCLQEPPRLHALGEQMLGVCRMEPSLVFLLDPDAVLPESSAASKGRRR